MSIISAKRLAEFLNRTTWQLPDNDKRPDGDLDEWFCQLDMFPIKYHLISTEYQGVLGLKGGKKNKLSHYQ